MSKIVEWQPKKGSFKNDVTNTLMTASKVGFIKSKLGFVGSFNGVDSTLITDSIDPTVFQNGFTVFVWNKCSALGVGRLLDKGTTVGALNGFYFGTSSVDYYTVNFNYGGVLNSGAGSNKIGSWQLVGITVSLDRKLNFWVGNCDTTPAVSGTPDQTVPALSNINTTNPLTIGNRSTATDRPFNGEIGHTLVIGKVLSSDEINQFWLETKNEYSPVEQKTNFFYEKPKDLSYLKDTGLVAAYNMKPVLGQLTDLSGNALNFTIPQGIVSSKKGLQFNNTSIVIGHNSKFNMSQFTVLARFKYGTAVASTFIGIMTKGTAAVGWRTYIDGANNRVRANVGNQLVSPGATGTLSANNYYTAAFIFRPGESITFWLDGVNLGAQAITNTDHNTTEDFRIGSLQTGLYPLTGEMEDARIYSRALTDTELKRYHNSFVRPYFVETFKDDPVGSKKPREWIIESGVFEVKEDTEKKYLECITSGTIKTPFKGDTEVDARIVLYHTGDWYVYEDTLANLIAGPLAISVSDGYLKIVPGDGERISEVIIYNGVKV